MTINTDLRAEEVMVVKNDLRRKRETGAVKDMLTVSVQPTGLGYMFPFAESYSSGRLDYTS